MKRAKAEVFTENLVEFAKSASEKRLVEEFLEWAAEVSKGWGWTFGQKIIDAKEKK